MITYLLSMISQSMDAHHNCKQFLSSYVYLILIDESVDDFLHHDLFLHELFLRFDFLLNLAQIPSDQIAFPSASR